METGTCQIIPVKIFNIHLHKNLTGSSSVITYRQMKKGKPIDTPFANFQSAIQETDNKNYKIVFNNVILKSQQFFILFWYWICLLAYLWLKISFMDINHYALILA